MIAYPDLTLTTTDITFSDPAPQPDDVITISATIHNSGGSYLDVSPTNIGSQTNGSSPATAGSYQESYYPANTNDGNYSTAWVSSYNSDWIKIDLGTIKSIKKIYWDDTYFADVNQPGSFTISVSIDNVSYTPIDSVTGYMESSYALILDTRINARYVKMEVTARDSGYAATLDELEVYEGYDTVVSFFDGDPDGTPSGTQINSVQYLAPVVSGGTGNASVEWTATSGSHDIYVVIDPDNQIIESNETNNKAYNFLSVAAEFINFTVTDYCNDDVNFGSLNPGMENQPADQTDIEGAVTLTVGSETNVNCNVQIKGTDFTGTGNIDIGNAKWKADNDVIGATFMDTIYNTIDTSTAGVEKIIHIWFWLTIPGGQLAGDYTSTFYYRAIKQ
jgi:hypothetical protein